MTQNTCIFSDEHRLPLPSFSTREAVDAHLHQSQKLWDSFLKLPGSMQQELIDFCMGRRGLKITYDTVFKKIFDTRKEDGLNRLNALLSAILACPVKIIRVLPRKGTQMSESTSFVVMDVLVQLNDGSFANVEMQKIGYSFPLARADCYIADIIMRQYIDEKKKTGKRFNFNNLHKVYSIVLMEQSPEEFHKVNDAYIHRRKTSFDTGIYSADSGLHEDVFICLDSFHSIVHNITKECNDLEAWLTFLSATDLETIRTLIEEFPCFASLYQEITDFVKNPEELIGMLSEELFIMDKNLERLMVTELEEKVVKAVAERDDAVTKMNIYRLKCRSKSPEEIADELKLSLEYVNSILNCE